MENLGDNKKNKIRLTFYQHFDIYYSTPGVSKFF